MKIVKSNLTARYYAVSVIRLDRVPFLECSAAESFLRCLYSMTEGRSDCSLEFLRIAPKESDRAILQYLILRTMHAEEAACEAKAACFFRGIMDSLGDCGYGCQEVSYNVFCSEYSKIGREETYFICRDIRKDPRGVLTVPQTEKVDMPAMYAALNGSGCAFSIHITPGRTSRSEAQYLEGMQSLFKNHSCDPEYASTLNLLSQRGTVMHGFYITMTLSGQAQAMAAASRVAAAIDAPTVILEAKSADYDLFSVPEQTWIRNKAVDELLDQRCRAMGRSMVPLNNLPKFCGLFTRHAPGEAARLLAFPVAGKGYVGAKTNIFSLLSRSAVLDSRLTDGGTDSLALGFSQKGLPLYLPLDELSCGVGIFGLTGSGKSVFILSLIRQLRSHGIPVLVISGAKKEMRKLIKTYPAKIYTPGVEHIAPIQANPFEIPAGSSAGTHKSAVVTVLASAVNMPSPLDALLTCAVDRAYEAFGYGPYSSWQDGTPFGIRDFLVIYRNMLAGSEYARDAKGTLIAAAHFRLLALLERAGGMMDALYNTFDTDALLTGLTVIEMEGLQECDRKLAAFLIMTSVMAKLQALPETGGKLRLAIVVDEAHALLSSDDEDGMDASRLAGLAIRNLMRSVITTMRSRGIGLIYADQSVSRAGGNALMDMTVNKFFFRLEGQEHRLAAESLHMRPEESRCLLNLDVGQTIFKTRLDTELIGLTTIYQKFGENVSDEELKRLVNGGQPLKRDPRERSVRLLEQGVFPCPAAVRRMLDDLDLLTAKQVIGDLGRRARVRGMEIPPQYHAVMHNYIDRRKKRGL